MLSKLSKLVIRAVNENNKELSVALLKIAVDPSLCLIEYSGDGIDDIGVLLGLFRHPKLGIDIKNMFPYNLQDLIRMDMSFDRSNGRTLGEQFNIYESVVKTFRIMCFFSTICASFLSPPWWWTLIVARLILSVIFANIGGVCKIDVILYTPFFMPVMYVVAIESMAPCSYSLCNDLFSRLKVIYENQLPNTGCSV